MKRVITTLVIAMVCMVFAGCGKNSKELDEYYDSMNDFTNEVTAIKDNMEAIDTSSESATTELLGYLDQLEEQFRVLSEIKVPKEFASNEDLADEAYEYMQKAVSLYHEYNDNPVNESLFEAACENYSRAMKRVGYISSILKGEIPEGDDIDVIEEDNTDFEPVTGDESDIEE